MCSGAVPIFPPTSAILLRVLLFASIPGDDAAIIPRDSFAVCSVPGEHWYEPSCGILKPDCLVTMSVNRRRKGRSNRYHGTAHLSCCHHHFSLRAWLDRPARFRVLMWLTSFWARWKMQTSLTSSKPRALARWAEQAG